MTYLYVACGGFIGSISRYLLTTVIGKKNLATFIINIIGCYLLGRTIFLESSSDYILFLQSGIIGSFTTFSALLVEDIKLIRKNKNTCAILYLILEVALGYLSFILGILH